MAGLGLTGWNWIDDPSSLPLLNPTASHGNVSLLPQLLSFLTEPRISTRKCLLCFLDYFLSITFPKRCTRCSDRRPLLGMPDPDCTKQAPNKSDAVVTLVPKNFAEL